MCRIITSLTVYHYNHGLHGYAMIMKLVLHDPKMYDVITGHQDRDPGLHHRKCTESDEHNDKCVPYAPEFHHHHGHCAPYHGHYILYTTKSCLAKI